VKKKRLFADKIELRILKNVKSSSNHHSGAARKRTLGQISAFPFLPDAAKSVSSGQIVTQGDGNGHYLLVTFINVEIM
jgi:hypothetical protein